jgi:tRNA(adenine34) deaminase
MISADRSGSLRSDVDIAMMRRCIRLSATSAQLGELPFAAVICKNEDIVVESTNRVVQSADISHHAELAAISAAQKIFGGSDLSGCTLYSIVEPCAMCAFAVRETGIGRVVFSLNSPIMGGLSKWNVLRDTELSHALPQVFGPVPEVIAGLLRQEAEKVWQAWNPVLWAVIKNRGYLGGGAPSAGSERFDAIPERRSFLRRLFALHKNHSA